MVTASTRSRPNGRTAGRSELGVAGFLAVVGAVVAIDALRLPDSAAQTGSIGPTAVPLLVSGLLIGCAVLLAVDVLRGGKGDVEGGEDVDLGERTDWWSVVLLALSVLGNALLIDHLGWVISGALLFWGCATALGSRRFVRDAVVAVTLSVLTFYGFYSGLGIKLPAGVLQGVL